jgi:hypothetical protein
MFIYIMGVQNVLLVCDSTLFCTYAYVGYVGICRFVAANQTRKSAA